MYYYDDGEKKEGFWLLLLYNNTLNGISFVLFSQLRLMQLFVPHSQFHNILGAEQQDREGQE